MSVYEHTQARTYGSGTHFVTVISPLAYCTCGGATPHDCEHIESVLQHMLAEFRAERHRVERLMVEHSIRVLPELPKAA